MNGDRLADNKLLLVLPLELACCALGSCLDNCCLLLEEEESLFSIVAGVWLPVSWAKAKLADLSPNAELRFFNVVVVVEVQIKTVVTTIVQVSNIESEKRLVDVFLKVGNIILVWPLVVSLARAELLLFCIAFLCPLVAAPTLSPFRGQLSKQSITCRHLLQGATVGELLQVAAVEVLQRQLASCRRCFPSQV